MKKLSKKLIIIISVSLIFAITLSTGVFTIFASNDGGNSTYDESTAIDEYKLIDDDFGLAENDERVRKEDEEYDKNDLLTLEILRGYGVTNETEIIDDKETDCHLMMKICEMINNDEFTSDELKVMKKYLERRHCGLTSTETAYVDGQDELRYEIENILGYDHWKS